MPKPKQNNKSIEEEIALLRDLLANVGTALTPDRTLEEKLAMLDSVSQAIPKLAEGLKKERDLSTEETDPMQILRQALLELEEEWPELRDCKERLRSGGAEPTGEAGV